MVDKTRMEFILDFIENDMDAEAVVDAWNGMVGGEEAIYPMESFNDVVVGKVWEAFVNNAGPSEFRSTDDWFIFSTGKYSHFKSGNNPVELLGSYDTHRLACHILEHMADFNITEDDYRTFVYFKERHF